MHGSIGGRLARQDIQTYPFRPHTAAEFSGTAIKQF